MDTVIVLCRSEHGAILELGLVKNHRGEWEKGPAYQRVVLNGGDPYGVTEGVPGRFMQEWLIRNRDRAIVKQGDIRIVEDAADTYENSQRRPLNDLPKARMS